VVRVLLGGTRRGVYRSLPMVSAGQVVADVPAPAHGGAAVAR
jgi:hypothetical protein